MDTDNLLKGEKINFGEDSHPDYDEVSDSDLDQRYVSGAVRIVTEQARYPLPSIPDMVEGPDYELNPEFQRRRRWDRSKQSRLIESFIINVPIPPIFYTRLAMHSTKLWTDFSASQPFTSFTQTV